MFSRKASPGVLWLAASMILSACAAPLEPTAPLDSQNPTYSGLAMERGDRSAGLESATGGLFYPLDLGNHWEYARRFRIQVFPNDGPPSSPVTIRSTLDKDLIGTEQRFGREYVVQLEAHREGEFVYKNRYLYRQDRGGLYNADSEPTTGGKVASTYRGRERLTAAALADRLVGTDPGLRSYRQAILHLLEKHEVARELALRGRMPSETDRARPGPLPGEIALLRYPLHTHQSWHVREDPLIIYTVEGQEVLNLPEGRFNAWRIRIDWPDLFSPNDRAHVWYGRSGQLKLAAHLEVEATDEAGNVYGRAVSDEVEVLADLELVNEPRRRGVMRVAVDSPGSAP